MNSGGLLAVQLQLLVLKGGDVMVYRYGQLPLELYSSHFFSLHSDPICPCCQDDLKEFDDLPWVSYPTNPDRSGL